MFNVILRSMIDLLLMQPHRAVAMHASDAIRLVQQAIHRIDAAIDRRMITAHKGAMPTTSDAATSTHF
jgi:hypothetical protein